MPIAAVLALRAQPPGKRLRHEQASPEPACRIRPAVAAEGRSDAVTSRIGSLAYSVVHNSAGSRKDWADT